MPSPSQSDDRSVRQLAEPFKDWRSHLSRLNGFPLVPVGAGPKGKAPIDPSTGKEASNWQANPQTPEQIAAMNGVVSCVGSLSGPQAVGGIAYIDIDGAAGIERCRDAGCSTRNVGWSIWRDTTNDRLKVVFRIPPHLRRFLQNDDGSPIGKRVLTIAPPVYGTDDNGNRIVLEPGQQIELFYGTGQCIILGQHKESGGHYYWKGSPDLINDPPPEWWALITEIVEARPKEAASYRKHTRNSGDSTQSGSDTPCRICGRDTTPACTEYRDGERVRINCFEGQTFGPPAGLSIGDTITIGSTTWGFCGQGVNPSIGGFSTFVEHIERSHTPSPAPKPAKASTPEAEPQGAAEGSEFKGTEWIRDQLQECLDAGLSTGQMATEVVRIASEADVYPATVEKLLAGLRADEQEAEDVADIADLVAEVSAAEQAVDAITLAEYFPPKLTAHLKTFQRGIPYKDLTLLMTQLGQTASTLKLGTRIVGDPFTAWEVPLNIYGIGVGPSGAKKSPLTKSLISTPSKGIESQLNRLNAQRFQEWEEECKTKKQNKPPKPIALCHVTNDYTAEALADQLAAHEKHKLPLLILRDEVAALFESFGKYKQGGKGSGGDEQQLLELFDGDAFRSLRCNGGRSYDACQVSLDGNTQDKVLRRLIAAGDANGKWARCIFYPLPEMTYQRTVPTAEDRQARRDAETYLEQLSTSLFAQAPCVYELDIEGIETILQYDYLCQQQRNEASLDAVKALKNKSAGKALRLAGLLHILHCHEQTQFTAQVPCTRLVEAINLVDTLDAWAASFHATAALSDANAQAVSNREHLLQRIHQIAAKYKGTVSWTTIRRTLKSSEKRGITAAMAKVMLQTLHDRGIGQLTTGIRGGLSYRATGHPI